MQRLKSKANQLKECKYQRYRGDPKLDCRKRLSFHSSIALASHPSVDAVSMETPDSQDVGSHGEVESARGLAMVSDPREGTGEKGGRNRLRSISATEREKEVEACVRQKGKGGES